MYSTAGLGRGRSQPERQPQRWSRQEAGRSRGQGGSTSYQDHAGHHHEEVDPDPEVRVHTLRRPHRANQQHHALPEQVDHQSKVRLVWF